MRIIDKALEKIRPMFGPDTKLSRLLPVFEAVDTIIRAAYVRTDRFPFGRDAMDVKRYMSLAIIALTPSFLASLYFFGWRMILLLAVSYVAGGTVEVLFSFIRKEEVNEGFLVTGFIFPLILPPGLPLWVVAVGVIFGTIVGKEIFGGTGRNLFNPALVGRIFLALGYPALMTSAWIEPVAGTWGRLGSPFTIRAVDAVTSATPLVAAKGGVITAPLDLFLGSSLGSAGETSALAIILGGVFLVAVGIANWKTVLSILISFAGLNALLRAISPDAVAPVWFNLMSGGLLFGTFFMATDPVSGPVTRAGKWAYGIIIGSVTILIRSFSGFVEGMMFAILFGNICAPLIDEVVIRLRMRRYAHEG
ncbi:MAG: RnfABCDGE type electron transport complex subunit D [Spirochaetales bacterium]|nr:RnfABCDGE type electron transport complex subunit D [Spirochaetales bacterium]